MQVSRGMISEVPVSGGDGKSWAMGGEYVSTSVRIEKVDDKNVTFNAILRAVAEHKKIRKEDVVDSL
jgi:hypothetical protein